MSSAIDLAFCVKFGGENGINGCHLGGFSEDAAFAHHFVATRPPPHSHPKLYLIF